jgi:uroporphyrinogen-III synthase
MQMVEKQLMLVTAPQPLWPDIVRYVGKKWEAVASPMVEVRQKEDRNFPRIAQHLQEGRFSFVIFTNLLSARFAFQWPPNLVKAAVIGMREALVVAQAPEVARELSSLGVDSIVPAQSRLYDFLDEHGEKMRGENVLMVSGVTNNPLIAVVLRRLGARIEQLTSYTSHMLEGQEQKDAMTMINDGKFRVITFESRIAVDSLFKVASTPRERRRLSRALGDNVVRAQNSYVAEALLKHGVDAWVPESQDMAHIFA